MFVCCECCVLSGRGLCDELITRPEKSYRLWCVVVCNLETSRMRRPWPALGRSATAKKRKKEPTRCDRVVEFTIPVFLNCSTCSRRHTAHHQKLKNCNCSLWIYIRFWLPAAAMASHRSGRQPKTYVKPEVAITVFELLMMGSVSPGTCWAIKKHWNSKFYYTVASCWFFLWDLYYDVRIYEHQVVS